MKFDGIDKTLCDVDVIYDVRKGLYENNVPSGGTTMYRGFTERLNKEITALALPIPNVRISASKDRDYGAWIGCAMLAESALFPQLVITRDDYEEKLFLLL